MSGDDLLLTCLKQTIIESIGYGIDNTSLKQFSDVFGLDVGGIPLSEFDIITDSETKSEIHLIFGATGDEDRYVRLAHNERKYSLGTESTLTRIFIDKNLPPSLEEELVTKKVYVYGKINTLVEYVVLPDEMGITFKADFNDEKMMEACLHMLHTLVKGSGAIGKMYFEASTIKFVKMKSGTLDNILTAFSKLTDIVHIYVPHVLDISDINGKESSIRRMVNRHLSSTGEKTLPEINEFVELVGPIPPKETVNDPFEMYDNLYEMYFIKGNGGISLVLQDESDLTKGVRVSNFIDPDTIPESIFVNTTNSKYRIEYAEMKDGVVENWLDRTNVGNVKRRLEDESVVYPNLGYNITPQFIFGKSGLRRLYKISVSFTDFSSLPLFYRFTNPQREV